MKVIYNTATTLTGYITDENNSLNWLFEVDSTVLPDHNAFLENIGVLVSGSTTYEWVLNEENLMNNPDKWPEYYGKRPMFVFTSRELQIPQGADVQLISGDPKDYFKEISEAANGKDIWLIGGGDLAGQFFDAGLLDEIHLSMAPVTLKGGAPVLPRSISSKSLSLRSVEKYGQFAHLIYDVKKQECLQIKLVVNI